ncbi:MAG TPA: four-carbon acid sugar kinase family protein [Steroidobacteraceae bacterium]
MSLRKRSPRSATEGESVVRPLYTYYGDDFTGSTDVLEALSLGGVRNVLFTGMPSERLRRQFADCQALGIAGESRSRPPQWMSEHLPVIFSQLGALGAPIVHYKTCSTFDSSPQIGSIGRALEVGRETLSPAFIPIVVAAPHLKRYVAFGNLFAAAGESICRIDRHPTMRSHPVTPMYEADLRRHLAAQTQLHIGLVDLTAFAQGRAAEALTESLLRGDAAVLFDGVSDTELEETGRLLWQHASERKLFSVGSSGLTYALLSAWRGAHVIAGEPAPTHATPVDTLLVVSGSCSPTTERQIRTALANGYHGIALDLGHLLDESCGAAAAEKVFEEAVAHLRARRSTLIYTALGPLTAATQPRGESLGRRAGALLRRILIETRVPRVVLAGGDTSSHAVAQLGIDALTWVASLEPGAPLCRAHAQTPELDGLQLVLKGGQVGSDGFFERMRLWR